MGHFHRLVLPPSLVRLSVASTASPFGAFGALLQAYTPAALARRTSKKYGLRSEGGQTDLLAEFSASAQRYMRSMSTQLKEGLTQVQVAMAAGLFEGLKEVTADVRHLNTLLRREFKRRIRRELEEQQIEEDRRRLEKQQQVEARQPAIASVARQRRVTTPSGSSSCPETESSRRRTDIVIVPPRPARSQTDTEATTAFRHYRQPRARPRTSRRTRRHRGHTESLVSVALAFSESSSSEASEEEETGVRRRHTSLAALSGMSPELRRRRRRGMSQRPKRVVPTPSPAPPERKNGTMAAAPFLGDWDPRLPRKPTESLSIRETRLRYRRHRLRRLEQNRLQAMAAALAARQDRYSDRLFELARLMPARADVWEIVLEPSHDVMVPLRMLKQFAAEPTAFEPSLRQSRFSTPAASDRTTPRVGTTAPGPPPVLIGPRPPLGLRSKELPPNGSFEQKVTTKDVTPAAAGTSVPAVLQNRRPLLVFVNAKSGGQVGAQLLKEFYKILNPMQVIDIQSDGGPQRALMLFKGLAMINRLRILVCGGDGTAGWVINEIQKLYGPPNKCHVPVGILPLGTGNDLSRILGWGGSFDGDVPRHLMKVETAQSRLLDLWQVSVMTRPVPGGPTGPGAAEGRETLNATFNNYMDIGVAARIAFRFHQLREGHPELFQSSLGNKFLYGEMGVREWVSEKGLDLSSVRIVCDGVPVVLHEPHIEGLIAINIPSFSGGVNLWPDEEQEDTDPFISHRNHCYGPPTYQQSTLMDALQAAARQHSIRSRPPSLNRHVSSRRMISPTAVAAEDRTSSLIRGGNGAAGSASSVTSYSDTASPVSRRDLSRKVPTNVGGSEDGGDSGTTSHTSTDDDEGATSSSSTDHRRRRVAASSLPCPRTSLGSRAGLSSARPRHIHSTTSHHPAPPMAPTTSWDPRGGASSPYHFRPPSRWRKQSMRDELIEVVAVRSLFHLGQVQVGLAEPVRVCQGRNVRIEVPMEVPFQIDGEPRILQPCVIHISHKGESFVLSPVKTHDDVIMNKVTEILDAAVKDGIITSSQRSVLLRELNKRV